MLLLAALDAAHVLLADELGWRVQEVTTGKVTGRGDAGDVPGRGGRWELDDQGVAWRPDGGAASPKWSGKVERVAASPEALWVQAKDTVVRIGVDVRPQREVGVLALGADAGGAVWASADAIERVDTDGKTVCRLALKDAHPVAAAASSAWIVLGDRAGLLLIDAAKCAPVAASPMRVDALTFAGDTIVAMRDGSLRLIRVPTLDAPVDRGDPGLLPLDAPDRPRLVDATGIHDPQAGSFVPIPAEHLVTARAVVARDGGRIKAWDATGRVFVDLADPLVALHFAATEGDALVASDGTRIVFSGGGVATPGIPFTEIRAVDARTALIREGARWWRVGASGAPERVASPWDGVRAGAAWLDAAKGSLGFAAAAVADGFRIVRRSDGHWVGPAILTPPGKSVAVDPLGRLAVTLVGEELVGFDLATGKPRWRSRDAAGAWAGVERVDQAAVVTATGAELKLVDPATGAVLWRIADGERVEAGARVWRPGDAALPWSGHVVEGTPADGGVAKEPTAILASFGWASGWNPVDRSLRDWTGWCGRGDEAASLLTPFPAIAARVATVLRDCDRPTPRWAAEKVEEHAAPTAIDEACNEPLPARLRDELPLPLQAGRPTLVVAGATTDVPPGVDLLTLGGGPEDYRADATGTRAVLTRARPLPACLAPLGDADGAVLIDGTGRARMRGDVASVARAAAALVQGDGAQAPPPVLRWRLGEPAVGLVAGDGAVVAWTAHEVGRVGPTDGAWQVEVDASAVRVVDGMVLVQEHDVVRALAVDSGRSLWRLPGVVVGRDGKRALVEDRGVTRAIDAAGSVAWVHAGPGERIDGGWTATVAGWTCTRDDDRAPRSCAQVDEPEPPDLRLGAEGVSLYKGRKQVFSAPGVTRAERMGGGRLFLAGPAVASRVVSEEGRTQAVLPQLRDVVVEGGRIWGVRGDGTIEVYRP